MWRSEGREAGGRVQGEDDLALSAALTAPALHVRWPMAMCGQQQAGRGTWPWRLAPPARLTWGGRQRATGSQ